MKTWILVGLAAVLVLLGTILIIKKVSPLGWGWWGEYNTSSGIALKGYDPVAYLSDSKPVKGSSEYAYDWRGATWQFASAENRDRFASDPETFAPQFGGFCSFAVSKGFTADVSSDAWHIEEGRLYLFADQNFRDKWVAGLGEGSLQQSSAKWKSR
jgi:YHS domain-containing protein